ALGFVASLRQSHRRDGLNGELGPKRSQCWRATKRDPGGGPHTWGSATGAARRTRLRVERKARFVGTKCERVSLKGATFSNSMEKVMNPRRRSLRNTLLTIAICVSSSANESTAAPVHFSSGSSVVGSRTNSLHRPRLRVRLLALRHER